MIFWTSVFFSLFCILKTKPTHRMNAWDFLFFLSSWQMFNLGIWHGYLAATRVSDPYRIASSICLLLTFLYLLRRGLNPDMGISGTVFREYLVWTGFLCMLIPVGLGIGFLTWNPRLDAGFIGNKILDYFFFVAPTEELVFRAFVFSLLKRTFGNLTSGALTTILFATIFSHITDGHFPNWTYVGMAFAAGGVYTASYHRTDNLLVPILLHGTVDSVWKIFFSL